MHTILIIRMNGSDRILEILQNKAKEKYDRNIDQLLEFIQGDDKKVQDKKKKRKKKQKNKEGPGLEAQPEVQETEALKGQALEAQALEVEASAAKALEDKKQTKDAKNICLDTVGECKKKVKIKQKTTDERMDKCIAEKEAMLEERRCYAESIIESKSKEMRILITGFEEAEDHKAAKMKEVAGIDAKVAELLAMKARLLLECEDKDQVMDKLMKKRKKLEEFLNSQIKKYKSETSKLDTELRDLKFKQLKQNAEEVFPSDEDKVLSEVKTIKTQDLQLLEYIDHKIEVKEKELECPVCLEVASAPIFTCDDLHLICSSCRPKVGCLATCTFN